MQVDSSRFILQVGGHSCFKLRLYFFCPGCLGRYTVVILQTKVRFARSLIQLNKHLPIKQMCSQYERRDDTSVPRLDRGYEPADQSLLSYISCPMLSHKHTVICYFFSSKSQLYLAFGSSYSRRSLLIILFLYDNSFRCCACCEKPRHQIHVPDSAFSGRCLQPSLEGERSLQYVHKGRSEERNWLVFLLNRY